MTTHRASLPKLPIYARWPWGVQCFVGELRDSGRSIQTCNFYLQAAKQFCTWLVKDRRAPDNPFEHLEGGNVDTDRRHERRSGTEDEFRRLVAAARKGPKRFGLTWPERV